MFELVVEEKKKRAWKEAEGVYLLLERQPKVPLQARQEAKGDLPRVLHSRVEL